VAIHGNRGVRAHHGADGTAGAFLDFFFKDDGWDVPHMVDVGCLAEYLFRASRDTEVASFAPFRIDNDIS